MEEIIYKSHIADIKIKPGYRDTYNRAEYNFTNNPTFVTGSGTLYNGSMVGDPKVYITTVGLYNDENELVATAKLSKPLQKSFSREATIRVKLDY